MNIVGHLHADELGHTLCTIFDKIATQVCMQHTCDADVRKAPGIKYFSE